MRRVFVIATLVALIHASDDAFVHRGPGYGFGQHLLAGLLALAGGLAAILMFPRLRPGVRAGVAFSFGVFALVNGAMHVGHLGHGGPAGADLTGFAAAAAGLVLIGLAAAIPWRHRGEGTWRSRAVAVPAGLLVVFVVVAPVATGIGATHKWREPVGSPPSAAYQDVTFHASDGLELAGWYRPSQNGAAVVVVHGGSSDRKRSVHHAKLLARHGYGVLAFLQARDDVDPGRIGAVGLSTGADALIDFAGERDDIAALVTDGAAATSFADSQRLNGTTIQSATPWVMFSTIRVLTGDTPTRPLADQVRKIASPTLMISAGTDVEHDFNVLYDEAAADGPVEHWNLPEAHHTDAIHEYPDEYERRVASFFDRNL